MSGRVHVEERNGLGVLVLDRPEALNALSHRMVQTVARQLARWRHDPTIRAVVVKAVPGRAFCAGGDIRLVVETAKRKGVAPAARFFFDEYRMNWRIGTFGKPFIALLDGITMGGGVGISVHGTHRLATENTLFAMPETGIGFFPDVGGSYFLPRLPRPIGLYLGVTGARLDGAAITRLGIATHFVRSTTLADLEAHLLDGPSIDAALAIHADVPAPAGFDTAAITRHFAHHEISSILGSLAAADDRFASETLATLRQKSPFSIAVTMAQLQRGGSIDLAGCLAMEYRMVQHFLAASDFAEGVRALLIDKDKRPRWRHAAIESVTATEIEACFAASPSGELVLDWAD